MQLQHRMAANRAHQQQRGGMNPYGVMYPQHQMPNNSMRSNMVPNAMPYQQPMGALGNANYGAANMYNAPATAPHMQPAPARVCNVSSEPQIVSSSPMTPANVVFRKLPFFKLKHQILRPTVLSPNSGLTLPPNVRSTATQEFNASIVLTCDMASDLAMFRDMTKNEYVMQVQLRITATDNNAPNAATEYDDFLPYGLMVRVNGRQCSTLPPCTPSTRQGQESRRVPRPISVTQLIKMSPMNVNNIIINWAHELGKTFVITLNIVEKLSADFLLTKLKERETISVDLTKLTIRQQYRRVIDDDNDATENADDDDIAATIIRVSLQCPLVKFRMQYPAKGVNCTHLQCFDGSAYISLNEKKPMWVCPVCSKALYYDDLALDQYFMDVLSSDQLADDCQEVQLFVDGAWKSYDEEKAGDNENGKNQSNSPSTSPGPSTSIITPADSSDDTVDRKDVAVAQPPSGVDGNAADPVVDLCSDDEDAEDAPESVTESEPVVTNTEERRDSNSSSSMTPAPQPEDSEKASNEVSSMDTSAAEPSADTVASVISSAVEEAMNMPIISLDSPSPSPPPFPASTTPALAGLNIEDS